MAGRHGRHFSKRPATGINLPVTGSGPISAASGIDMSDIDMRGGHCYSHRKNTHYTFSFTEDQRLTHEFTPGVGQ
jgi:hypothetical protein